MPNNPVELSMWMSSFLPFYVAEKHALLVSTSTRERLRACIKCVASMETVAKGPPRQDHGGGVEMSDASASTVPPPSPPPPLAGGGMAGRLPPGATAAAEAAISVGAGGGGARG